MTLMMKRYERIYLSFPTFFFASSAASWRRVVGVDITICGWIIFIYLVGAFSVLTLVLRGVQICGWLIFFLSLER